GGDPADEVEEGERDRAQAILDVVPEDPQEQHVAQQVYPAAVQEHARDHAEHCRPQVIAAIERASDVSGHGAPVPEEGLEGRVAPGSGDRQLDGKGDEAGADEPERHDRRPAGGVPVAEGDHWLAAGEAGPSEALGPTRAGCSRARLTPFALIQTRASGSPSSPGSTYIPRMAAQAAGSTARRYWAMNAPSTLDTATIRLFARSSPYMVPTRRAAPDAISVYTGAGRMTASPGSVALQPALLPPTTRRSSPPS